MTLLKKITILKIAVIVIVCIIMANEYHRMINKFPYLFNLFMIFISSIYVFLCFKFVNDKYISVNYFLIVNSIFVFLFFPLMYSMFSGFLPLESCLFFSLSMADSVFFGLTLYKFAYDKISNGAWLKLLLGNMTDKKN
ncbi:TPA: hypothetical protein OOF32_003261 [Morganella morganii]|nr:hypothetical protein [Morganella morganii]